jgi:hypothetical protein
MPTSCGSRGASDQCVTAIVEGKLDEAGLTPAERALLDYAELITQVAYRSTSEDVEKLRLAGWKEGQISESCIHHSAVRFLQSRCRRIRRSFAGLPHIGEIDTLRFDGVVPSKLSPTTMDLSLVLGPGTERTNLNSAEAEGLSRLPLLAPLREESAKRHRSRSHQTPAPVLPARWLPQRHKTSR